MSLKTRIRYPCDGCTVRRVKCEDIKPCSQCRVRGIQCTSIQARQKRGPKGGPRDATSTKIRQFQKLIRDSHVRDRSFPNTSTTSSIDGTETDGNHESSSPSGWSPAPSAPPAPAQCNCGSESPAPRRGVLPGPPTVHRNLIPLEEYRCFIRLFHQQAFPIWPVVSADGLLGQLSQPDPDPECLALAASLCAATIAQLRLPEHMPTRNSKSSLQFATECLWFRERYDYRETHSTASVLIPFFLHIYYANANKLRTAGFFLRESIAYVHATKLGQPQTYQHLDEGERALRLRIYWLLFISERTYCVQHAVPATLRPISTPPDFEYGTGDDGMRQAFRALSRLFVYLEVDSTTTAMTAPGDALPLEKQKVVSYQTNLSLVPDDVGATHEAQRVDLFVTRQWIRLLLWEYTSRHFALASCPAHQAFSLFLPVKIGHELLSLFSMVTDAAVKTHGYGMELKVFRLADSLLDLVECASASARGNAMLASTGDMLYSFRRVLVAVGGQDSAFLRKLHLRMSQVELVTGAWPYHALPVLDDGADDDNGGG